MGDATRILVPQMARLWLAPVGTAGPDGPTATPATGWLEAGLFAPDSLSFTTDPNFEEVRSHQSNFPTRRWQTQDTATVQCNLQEWSANNILAVYGGGTITTVTPSGGTGTPYYRFSPPQIGGRTQTACLIDVIDGSKHYRRVIPLCEQDAGVEATYNKANEVTLPLRLTIIGSDVGDPWYEMTDDPAMAPPTP
jgi:hypothetical protein